MSKLLFLRAEAGNEDSRGLPTQLSSDVVELSLTDTVRQILNHQVISSSDDRPKLGGLPIGNSVEVVVVQRDERRYRVEIGIVAREALNPLTGVAPGEGCGGYLGNRRCCRRCRRCLVRIFRSRRGGGLGCGGRFLEDLRVDFQTDRVDGASIDCFESCNELIDRIVTAHGANESD